MMYSNVRDVKHSLNPRNIISRYEIEYAMFLLNYLSSTVQIPTGFTVQSLKRLQFILSPLSCRSN